MSEAHGERMLAAVPKRPPTPCRKPGCPQLVPLPGYCAVHRRADVARRSTDNRRAHPAETALYHTARWLHERRLHLQQHPLCAECMRAGRLAGGTQVDHVIPHHGDLELFWRQANWQSLCASCHSRKTVREQGPARATEEGIHGN